MLLNTVIIILYMCTYAVADHVDAVKTSPSGRFVATGNQIGILVTDTQKKVSKTKYGHPLGFTTPVIWVNDSVLIVSSSCCEAGWWFITYWPSGNAAYLKPKNGVSSAFDRIVRAFMSTHSIDSLYYFLQYNAFEQKFDSDSLMIGIDNTKLTNGERN